MYPFYVMALLFLSLAALAALDTSLVNLSVFSAFPSLRWLGVHVITLGALTEFVFGMAPALTAALLHHSRPKIRWDMWIVLNAGLLILLAGIPMVNEILIIAGGTLVFIAAIMLAKQIVDIFARPELVEEQQEGKRGAMGGYSFYVAGLIYLMVGIIVGTGLWLGWDEPLRIVTPKEVHVHSNLWGFASLVFAGLLIDLYPGFSGQSLAWPRSSRAIFWLMVVGALGLVTGPWLEVNTLTVVGLVLHTIGTVWLLLNLFRPLIGKREKWTPGVWHLAAAYVWFLLAVVVAPLVVAASSVGAEVAGSGGPILIYGWILQVGYALIPYLFLRGFQPDKPGRLGGSWFSLVAVNAGSLLYWISLFMTAGQGPFRGVAYIFWIVSLLPVLMDMRETLTKSSETLQTMVR